MSGSTRQAAPDVARGGEGHCDPATGPDPRWAAYAATLAGLHRERDAAVRAHVLGEHERAERRAALRRLDADLAAARARLVELAAALRAPLRPDDLGPSPVPPLPWSAGLADLATHVEATSRGVAETRRVAALPQLLPAWSGAVARAAVVYAGFGVPSALLTVLLSLLGVSGGRAAFVGFAVVWPAVTAVAGAWLVGRLTAPRLPAPATGPGTPDPAAPARPDGAHTQPVRRYVLLGLLVAWASWLVPAYTLDWLMHLGG